MNHVVPERYKYIALLDTDEVIIPIKQANWMDMMDEFMEQSKITKEWVVASWNFRNVNFLNNMADLRDRFHMMRKV